MQMYTIDDSNKYLLRVNKIQNIEDAGDDFSTEEELREILGLTEDEPFYHRAVTPNEKLIAEELASWVAKIPKDGKSIICTDEVLLEALKEVSTWGYAASKYLPGIRRVGNRLSYSEKPTRRTNKKDYAWLINQMVHTAHSGKRFRLEMKYTAEDRSGSLALMKKLMTWEEIDWSANCTEEDKKHMREIWDNPTMFDGDTSD